MAARHANPGIRLRASALHRRPRGCDKLGHFPVGPDRPGRSEAAFADSEGLGKSHGAGGRACLGQHIARTAAAELGPLARLYPCAARGSGPGRPASGPPGPASPPTALRRLPPRRRRKCMSLGGGSRRRRVRLRSPGRAEARAPVGRVASTIGCSSGEPRVLTPAGGGEGRKPRVDWRPRRGTGRRARRRNLTPWQRAATSGGLPPRARAQVLKGEAAHPWEAAGSPAPAEIPRRLLRFFEVPHSWMLTCYAQNLTARRRQV